MSRSKTMSLLAAAAILALAACSDMTGPEASNKCPIGGGPGTCAGVAQN